MALLITTSVVLLLASFTAAADKLHPLSDEFITLINSQQNSWKAGRNFAKDTSMTYIRRLLGAVKDENMPALSVKQHDADLIASLPAEFDSRQKWPNCPSLHEIRDQGNCGSCWAIASVETMTDRVCIFSNGAKQFHFSVEDVISCMYDDGCDGNDPRAAFNGWVAVGIVSGGPYNSSEGCLPYQIPPCDHNVEGKSKKLKHCVESKTPKCNPKCRDGYNIEYKKDKQYCKRAYMVEGEDNIKAEIFKHGPVVASFIVYSDFLHYKNDVYSHKTGEALGGHSVKMLGWGEEGGQKYWLMANSWNSDWGDNGYFKIQRGTNDCGIEEEIVAGEPDLSGF